MSELDSVKNYQSVTEEIAALRNENSMLKEELAYLKQQMDWLNKHIFGRKSEQTSVIMDDDTQLSLFSESTENDISLTEETITVPEHKRKKKRTHDDWMEKLTVKEELHEEEHPVCDKCSSDMEYIGSEKAYDELVYVPAQYFIRRHMVAKYICKKCGGDPESSTEPCNIKRAEYPKPMISKGYERTILYIKAKQIRTCLR